ncbi:hypothetical protein DW66_1022 [Pseudomonas putida]|nr:hypothetical protein DW66_1022 [Pseudomonas putida]
MQVYRIRPLSPAPAGRLIAQNEVPAPMSFTRRQMLKGLTGLVVVGLGAGGAAR